MTAEELDVCRNLEASAAKGMKSKRMLRILSGLQGKGLIEYDPFAGAAALTAAGTLALTSKP
jgi:hypothetical protein